MPPYGPSEATAVEAYWLYCDGLSYPQVAATLGESLGYYVGRTTAVEWVEKGRQIEAESGGPMRKRTARREIVATAISRIRVAIAEDVKAGRFDADRAKAYRLQLDALRLQTQLQGLEVPKALPKRQQGGTKPPSIDPDVIAAILALEQGDLDR